MPGEFELIRTYFKTTPVYAGVVLGAGDDCALVKVPPGYCQAITTDTLNEGSHIFTGEDPYLLGRTVLLPNISDLLAMGARPRYITLSVVLPSADPAFLAPFSRGLREAAAEYGVDLIGGNTTKGPLSITISAYGELKEGQELRRSRAVPGDDIYVTEYLGLSGLYVKCGYHEADCGDNAGTEMNYLLANNRLPMEFSAALYPASRCAIDISDGLAGDLGHILEQSGAGAEVYLDALPLHPYFARARGMTELEKLDTAAYGG